MLKGTRDAVVKEMRSVSIHGQMSWEIVFTHLDDPEEQLRAARVGPEAIEAGTLEVGDMVDGSNVALWTLEPYSGGRTYDLLPAGASGTYWANGILLASTLSH